MSSENHVEIEQCIHNFFHAMDGRDLELMKRTVAHDKEMVHIGTDADEIWRGWDDLHRATLEQFERLEYYKAEIRDLTIHVSRSGDVAWYEHLLDAEIKSGNTITKWKGARFTGVFEHRDDRWVMVQTHVSLPAAAG